MAQVKLETLLDACVVEGPSPDLQQRILNKASRMPQEQVSAPIPGSSNVLSFRRKIVAIPASLAVAVSFILAVMLFLEESTPPIVPTVVMTEKEEIEMDAALFSLYEDEVLEEELLSLL